jgi:hypothetical protein
LRHQLAVGGGCGEDVGESRTGGERLALLDAECSQHGQIEAVPFVDDLVLVDVVQQFPVLQTPGLVAGPWLIAG